MVYTVNIYRWNGKTYGTKINSLPFDNKLSAIDHAKKIAGDNAIDLDDIQDRGYGNVADFRDYLVSVNDGYNNVVLSLYTDNVEEE